MFIQDAEPLKILNQSRERESYKFASLVNFNDLAYILYTNVPISSLVVPCLGGRNRTNLQKDNVLSTIYSISWLCNTDF